ncbi:uncharacterized protein LOC107003203 isoform X2 [Solanum pennellii]|uniref:Uncharacterized protein LOC107003203 isoform X2 n=1 Tax=Solanum pennellii TaxID=28526 RepID=A0ABM1FHM5_SOLPN|nr:uncharacterized protein LOC107003203 isoform X2 [Solanum pennellii]
MANVSICCCFANSSITPTISQFNTINLRGQRSFVTSAAKSGGFSLKSGTGKNKKNGNIFERWKCFDCQGFGLKSCPVCGKGGLTPEQRGER